MLLVTSLLVSPRGEFALNDDWIHASVVHDLLSGSRYTGHPYVAATLIAQAYWGALFCKIAGFSFTTLRISTLILAGVAAWATARSALSLGLSHRMALLAGFVVLTSPLVLNLAYSFMTDVPFLAVSIVSGYFFLRALESEQVSPGFVALGSTASLIACGIRQNGFVVAAAFIATVFIGCVKGRICLSKRLVASVVIPWLIGLPIAAVLTAERVGGNSIFEPVHGRVAMAAMNGLRHFPVSLSYIGLFLSPLALPWLWKVWRCDRSWSHRKTRILCWFCALSLALMVFPRIAFLFRSLVLHRDVPWLAAYRYRMPLLNGDYLLDFGIGNLQMVDFSTGLHLGVWWWPLTAVAVLAAGLIFVSSASHLRAALLKQDGESVESLRVNQKCFLVIWGALMIAIAYNPWRFAVFDRYLLPALPPFVLLLAYEIDQLKMMREFWVAAVGCALMYVVALACLQDYLGWNRLGWLAQERLMLRGVPSKFIRGVDAASGWYNSGGYMSVTGSRLWKDANLLGHGPWVTDDEYVITAADQRPGYVAIERDEYVSWLTGKSRAIVTFRRDSTQARANIDHFPVETPPDGSHHPKPDRSETAYQR